MTEKNESARSDEHRGGSDRRAGDRRGGDRRTNLQAAAEWKGPERRVADRRRSERRMIERRSAELPQGLHLLDLPQPRPGFRHLVSSWFFVDSRGQRILVDPGPAGTIPLLLEKLSSVTEGVDFILLTHIHLDHAGGIGELCKRYENARVMVHPEAAKHLIEPDRLWKSSLDALGDVAELDGAPVPLNPVALLIGEIQGVTVLETPGHAPHHLSFIVPFQGDKLFFVGEAAGIFLPLASAGRPYLRPATPVKFDETAARNSFRKIEEALRGDEILCYAHWGATRRSKAQVGMAKEQLENWISVVTQMKAQSEEEIADYLISHVSFLSGSSHLPEDLRARERFFIQNSVRGLLG